MGHIVAVRRSSVKEMSDEDEIVFPLCEECGLVLAEIDKYCPECGITTELGVATEALKTLGDAEKDSFTTIVMDSMVPIMPTWNNSSYTAINTTGTTKEPTWTHTN